MRTSNILKFDRQVQAMIANQMSRQLARNLIVCHKILKCIKGNILAKESFRFFEQHSEDMLRSDKAIALVEVGFIHSLNLF